MFLRKLNMKQINKSKEYITTNKSSEELLNTLLSSKNINNLSLEAIEHIKNIVKEVTELDKLNFDGSAYVFVAMLLIFMSGNTFNVNKEENNFKTE